MKQAEISIPDSIHTLAARIAHQLGVTRTEVFVKAVAEYADRLRLSQEMSAVQAAQAELEAGAGAVDEAPRRKTLTRHEAHTVLDESCW